MAFDLRDIMSKRSLENTEKKRSMEIVEKDVDKLIPSQDNFYNTEKLEKMKASIVAFGVLQPLLIKKTERGDEIIAGHCRQKCCSELVRQGYEHLKMVPCIYQETQEEGESKALIDELLIMQTNTYREKSDWEKMTETIRTEEIISQLRKDMNLKGKTRDYLEGIINVKGTQAARYKVIYKNLIGDMMQEFKNGNIGVSVAYETARLSPEGQQKAFQSYKSNGMLLTSTIDKIREDEQIPGQIEFPDKKPKEPIKSDTSETKAQPKQEKKEMPESMIAEIAEDIWEKIKRPGHRSKKHIEECDKNMAIVMLSKELNYSGWTLYDGICDCSTAGVEIKKEEDIYKVAWRKIAEYLIEKYGKPKKINILPLDAKEEEEKSKELKSIRTPCIHLEGYSCTLSEGQKTGEASGEMCSEKCCMGCENKRTCQYACDACRESIRRENDLNEEELQQVELILKEQIEMVEALMEEWEKCHMHEQINKTNALIKMCKKALNK